MRKIGKTTVVCLIMVSLPFFLFAAGETGADFLRVEPPAETAAMSNVFAGIADNLNTIVFNPAGLINLNCVQVSFTHFTSFVDTNCEYLAGAVPLESKKYGVLGAAFYVDYTFDFPYYNDYGDQVGNVDNYDAVMIVSYAYQVYDWLAAGINLKYFDSKLYLYSKDGFAGDLGVLVKINANPDTFAGITIQNIGSQSAYITVVDPLPANIKAGMGIKFPLGDQVKVTAGMDVNRLISKDELLTLDIGTDVKFMDVLSLRAGYGFRYDSQTISFGVGLTMDNIRFSYSYQPFDTLGQTNRISVDVDLFNDTKTKPKDDKTDK
jgi:hypothetical protein